MEQVGSPGSSPVTIDEGQTGTVYALEVGGEKIAVFKPLEGEMFKRKGVENGQFGSWFARKFGSQRVRFIVVSVDVDRFFRPWNG